MTIVKMVDSLPPQQFTKLTKLQAEVKSPDFANDLAKVMRDALLAYRKRQADDLAKN